MEHYKEYNKDLSLKAQKEFNDQITEFNSYYRLGIDLGDKTGVAIVKDNKIILAKTLIDFHTKKLDDRRKSRRNRRTRLSRKKRLARLRSWVMRQKVGDQRLPDPYKIMHDNKYWSIYNKSNSVNKKNWVDLLIHSNSLSADDFVRGLTIIFRKRGYLAFKYLSRLSDKEFEKYIDNLKPPISKYEYEEDLEELSSRVENGEVEEKKFEGLKNKLDKIDKESKDFQVKQREEVKKELEDLVDLFAKSVDNKIDKEKWKRELNSLLDKKVRKIRFDNRFILKCKIKGCNRNTPKRENVRDFELKMALNNARSDYPISDEDLNSFRNEVIDIFQKKENLKKGELKGVTISDLRKQLNKTFNKAKIKKGIREQIRSIMFEKISGRSKFCKEHLKEFSEKPVPSDRINYGVNPAREQHDFRVLNFIDKKVFKDKLIDPSKLRYITIESPEPETERLGKGQISEKSSETLKEKLAKETDGIDIYTGEKLKKDFETEHIFPRARMGPSIRENEVASNLETNKEKADRTPWEWFGQDEKRWSEFEKRVNSLYRKKKISERKREILLNKSNEYPGLNPTDLSRIPSTLSDFVESIRDMFVKYGYEEPQTLLQKGKPIIQVVRGRDTQSLRWRWHALDSDIIPEKDRKSSFNHAEDAVIAACTPPYYLRQKILREEAKIKRKVSNKEKEVTRPDMPTKKIAPNWSEFMKTRKEPVIEVIGKVKPSWKNSIMDQTFYKYLLKPFKDNLIKIPNAKNTYKWIGVNGQTDSLSLPSKVLSISNKKVDSSKVLLVHDKDDGKRNWVSKSIGGLLVYITPKDGPKRIVQVKPATQGLLIYRNEDDKVDAVREFINPVIEMYNNGKLTFVEKENEEELLKYFNLLKKGQKFERIRRYDMITYNSKFYYVTKINKNHRVTIQEESKIKAESNKVKSSSGKEYTRKETEELSLQKLAELISI